MRAASELRNPIPQEVLTYQATIISRAFPHFPKDARCSLALERGLRASTQPLELELIQTQMAQKPMLRAEVYAHAMRASQNRKKEVRREKKV